MKGREKRQKVNNWKIGFNAMSQQQRQQQLSLTGLTILIDFEWKHFGRSCCCFVGVGDLLLVLFCCCQDALTLNKLDQIFSIFPGEHLSYKIVFTNPLYLILDHL